MRVAGYGKLFQVPKRESHRRLIELPSNREAPQRGDNLDVDEVGRMHIRIARESRTGSNTPRRRSAKSIGHHG